MFVEKFIFVIRKMSSKLLPAKAIWKSIKYHKNIIDTKF